VERQEDYENMTQDSEKDEIHTGEIWVDSNDRKYMPYICSCIFDNHLRDFQIIFKSITTSKKVMFSDFINYELGNTTEQTEMNTRCILLVCKCRTIRSLKFFPVYFI
jgi:hypothetical protein